MVTLVERVTKFTLCAPISNKSADAVTHATIELLLPYKHIVHTITSDNGKEFAKHEIVSKALDSTFYFADPYCSWQRGLNENHNRLLRQYWPKNQPLNNVSKEEAQAVMDQLNARPRKLLAYNTPAQWMSEYINEEST